MPHHCPDKSRTVYDPRLAGIPAYASQRDRARAAGSRRKLSLTVTKHDAVGIVWIADLGRAAIDDANRGAWHARPRAHRRRNVIHYLRIGRAIGVDEEDNRLSAVRLKPTRRRRS